MNDKVFMELLRKKPFTYLINGKCYVIGGDIFVECDDSLTELCRKFNCEIQIVSKYGDDINEHRLEKLENIYRQIFDNINTITSHKLNRDELSKLICSLDSDQITSLCEQAKNFVKMLDWIDDYFLDRYYRNYLR